MGDLLVGIYVVEGTCKEVLAKDVRSIPPPAPLNSTDLSLFWINYRQDQIKKAGLGFELPVAHVAQIAIRGLQYSGRYSSSVMNNPMKTKGERPETAHRQYRPSFERYVYSRR